MTPRPLAQAMVEVLVCLTREMHLPVRVLDGGYLGYTEENGPGRLVALTPSGAVTSLRKVTRDEGAAVIGALYRAGLAHGLGPEDTETLAVWFDAARQSPRKPRRSHP